LSRGKKHLTAEKEKNFFGEGEEAGRVVRGGAEGRGV